MGQGRTSFCCSFSAGYSAVNLFLSDNYKNTIFLPVSITSHLGALLKTSDQELTRWGGFVPISESICT